MLNIACAGLATQQWLKPAPADARETLHNAARDGDGRAFAGKLLGLAAASLSGYRAKVSVRLGDGGALCRAARFPPYPYPSETGDRRSWAIPRPVGSPKYPWHAWKRPREPGELR